MKKIIQTLSILLVVILAFVITPSVTFGQTFKSEAEIDAYYDQQIKSLEAENAQKNKAVEANLQKELNAIDKKYVDELWRIRREAMGDLFEQAKPFYPESNPDLNVQLQKILQFPEKEALNAINIITMINKEFGERLKIRYDQEIKLKTNVKYVAPIVPVQKQPQATTKTTLSATDIFLDLDSSITISDHIDRENKFSELKETNPTLYKEVFKLAENKYFKGKTDPRVMFEYMDSLSEKDAGKFSDKLQIFYPELKNNVNDIMIEKYPDGKFNDDGTIKAPAPISTSTVEPYTQHPPLTEKTVSEIQTKSESTTFIQKVSGFFKKLMFWK